jgi:hypothetical protein
MEQARVNCAGQGCEAREGCRRFRIRLPRLGQVELKHRLYDWASFDLEALLQGECRSFVAYREM